MPGPCRPSEIRIPNDPAFAGAAARYCEEVARLIGFPEPDLRPVGQGVREAITALIGYSFEPGEKSDLLLRCEHVPEGLKITIRDRGLPFGSAEVALSGEVCSLGDSAGFCSRVFGLKTLFDEVRLKGLGPEGKETVLVKHLKGRSLEDRYRACEIEQMGSPPPPTEPPPEKPKWNVRTMSPSEAPEVARLVYRAYGYTYAHAQVYYPDRFAVLSRSERIHPVVAVAENGEIAGHAVLQRLEHDSRIAELAQAVVAPEHRARGCLSALTDHLIRLADGMGLHGVFTKSVTEHTFSQKSAQSFGFRDCALLLGIIPKDTEFRGMSTLAHRGSLLLQYRYLGAPQGGISYVPSRHREMITRLYENLGGTAQEIRPDPVVGPRAVERSSLNVEALAYLQYARIELSRCGSDVLAQVKTNLKELCLQGFEIIHLHLDLSEPWTAHLAGAFEDLGFFFSGVLPGAFADGDALILQFLNKVAIPYDTIQLESAFAREMLDYIKARDPNA